MLKNLVKNFNYHHHVRFMGFINNRIPYWVDRVGYREMVCHGFNGLPIYADRAAFPFPAIRYMETSKEIQGLFEKQKGDWRMLTKDEKRALYRANYCLTFAEFEAPTGEWMHIIGKSLILISLGLWLFIFFQLMLDEKKPDSFKAKNVRAQMRRIIDIQADPIQGLCSNWDYEKGDWKVKSWFTPVNPFIKCDDDDNAQEEGDN